MPDCTIINKAPDADEVVLSIAEWKICISRDEHGTVFICAEDELEGSSTRLVLGQEGETQRL